jgi:hypothetical protein
MYAYNLNADEASSPIYALRQRSRGVYRRRPGNPQRLIPLPFLSPSLLFSPTPPPLSLSTADHCWSTLCRDTAQASPRPKPRTYIPGCSLSRGAGRRRERTTTETVRLRSLQQKSRREEGQQLRKIRNCLAGLAPNTCA